jgi:hypothetical protein
MPTAADTADERTTLMLVRASMEDQAAETLRVRVTACADPEASSEQRVNTYATVDEAVDDVRRALTEFAAGDDGS